MGLGGGERLLGDSQSMRDTYCLILTTPILTAFQFVAMNVGSGGPGVWNITPDLRNGGVGACNIRVDIGNDVVHILNIMMNVGDSNVDVRNAMTNIRDRWMCTCHKFSLEVEN